jgi:hypothetical protein
MILFDLKLSKTRPLIKFSVIFSSNAEKRADRQTKGNFIYGVPLSKADKGTKISKTKTKSKSKNLSQNLDFVQILSARVQLKQ